MLGPPILLKNLKPKKAPSMKAPTPMTFNTSFCVNQPQAQASLSFQLCNDDIIKINND